MPEGMMPMMGMVGATADAAEAAKKGSSKKGSSSKAAAAGVDAEDGAQLEAEDGLMEHRRGSTSMKASFGVILRNLIEV